MADQLARGNHVIHGPIDHKRPFLHGKDAANMFFYGLTSLDSGDRFLVAGKQTVQLRDFLETMIQVSGKQDVVTEQDPSFGTGLPRRT
jgi:nucleoside-diphosphate-sugar epimerase